MNICLFKLWHTHTHTEQSCLSESISALEKATHMANQLGLFSSNEEVEEVATTDLK